jgi:hypothetical protein
VHSAEIKIVLSFRNFLRAAVPKCERSTLPLRRRRSFIAHSTAIATAKYIGGQPMHRRISNSPLIDPAVSTVIMMAPAAPDLLSISPDLPTLHSQSNAAITQAAGVLDVPLYTLLWRPEPQNLAVASQASHPSRRQFLLEEYQCPWLNRAFVEALSREDASVLIVGGFWLEHEILGTALHALADSYDVAILADITPPRQAPAADAATERLVQAGATPIVTSQLIREWMVAAPVGAKREALRALLPAAAGA